MKQMKAIKSKKSAGAFSAVAAIAALVMGVGSAQQAEAGEAEIAAGVLLGTALIIAAGDDDHRHTTHVHYRNPYPSPALKHQWRHRDGRRYCDLHHSFHADAGSAYYHGKKQGWKQGYYQGKRDSHGEHHHWSGRDGYRYDRRQEHKYDKRKSGHTVERYRPGYGEARWNTRVRAY